MTKYPEVYAIEQCWKKAGGICAEGRSLKNSATLYFLEILKSGGSTPCAPQFLRLPQSSIAIIAQFSSNFSYVGQNT